MHDETTTTAHGRTLATLALVTLAVLALGAGSLAGTAAATTTQTATDHDQVLLQPDNGSGTNQTTTNTGGYTLDELRENGDHPSDAPPSVRMLGPQGSVSIVYTPTGLFSPDEAFLEYGDTINTDEVELYSTRFGESVQPQEYTLNVVYYDTAPNPQGTGKVPTDVTHDRVSVELGTGYDRNAVSLHSNYDDSRHITMWLEDENGDPVEGVRWANIQHRSSPTGQDANVDTMGDLWYYVGMYAFLPGVVGLVGAFGVGRHILSRIGSGPNLGVGTYGVFIAIAAFITTAFFHVRAAAVLNGLPVVWGLVIGLIGLIGYLEVGGPDPKRYLFQRDRLTDAKSPSGDDVKDSVFEETVEREGVELPDGSIGLPKRGLKAAIARYFADPATLDELDVSTSIEVGGDFDEKFISDPDVGEVLVHTPAHLEWDPQLIQPADSASADGILGGLVTFLERVNWAFVLGSLLFLGGGYAIFDATTGYGGIGIAAGMLGVALMGYKARDGEAHFEPAPIHYRSAKATVQNLAVDYDDAKTIEEAERARFEAEATTAAEVRDKAADRSKVTSQRLAEETVGVEFDISDDENRTIVEHPDDQRDRSERGTDRRRPAPDGGDEDDDGGGWRDA